jgi:hypothetical protein
MNYEPFDDAPSPAPFPDRLNSPPPQPPVALPPGKKASDPRHIPCKDAYFAYCKSAGVDALWNEKAAGALSHFLKSGKEITVDRFTDMLSNRLTSEGAVHGDEPHKVIASINRYAQGPLDRYEKLKIPPTQSRPVAPTKPVHEYGSNALSMGEIRAKGGFNEPQLI